LLRECRKRPCSRSRTSEQLDELASFHRDDPKPKNRAEYSKSRSVHRSKSGPLMSALGQKRTSPAYLAMSALPLKADRTASPPVRPRISGTAEKAPAIDDRGKLAERLEVRVRLFPLCIA
jgi:hypothetical protein